MRRVLALGATTALLLASPVTAHRDSKVDHFRVASKHVRRYSVEGYFKVSHGIKRHVNDGNEFTTETWCDIWVRAALVKSGRIVSRDSFVAYGAPHNEKTSLAYWLPRKGWRKPAGKRAKKLVVRHVHVDRASCAAI